MVPQPHSGSQAHAHMTVAAACSQTFVHWFGSHCGCSANGLLLTLFNSAPEFDKGSGLDHPSSLGTRLRTSNFISPVGAVNQSTFRTLHIREKKALLQLCQRGSSLQLCRALCRARVSRHADYAGPRLWVYQRVNVKTTCSTCRCD